MAVKNLLALTITFTLALAGVWYLDREDKLPTAYTGTPQAKAKEPPPARWYQLKRPFTIGLRDEGSVRLTVALQLPKTLPKFVQGGDAEGQLEQEAVIRQIVTDTVMARSARTMRSAAGRKRVAALLRRRIRAHTDVRVRRVVLPDVIVR